MTASGRGSNRLLVVTAVLYAAAGTALLFAPDELLAALAAPASPIGGWLAQALGAALLALAWMNWLQRATRTGGIYGRLVVLPNLIFALTAGLSAFSAWRRSPQPALLVAAIVFGALAAAFGSRLYARAPES